VFATGKGTPLDAQNIVNRHFKALLKRANRAYMRWHDLRHTYATLLLASGTHPTYVQQLAPHGGAREHQSGVRAAGEAQPHRVADLVEGHAHQPEASQGGEILGDEPDTRPSSRNDARRVAFLLSCLLVRQRGRTQEQKNGPDAPEGGRLGVRRTIVLLAATALALALASGVALAQQRYGDQGGQGVTKTCPTACQGTSYPDTLKGTSAPNQIRGLGGNEGLRTGDLIQGFANRDLLFGNPGGDRIEGGNGIDAIFGGRGQDLLIGGKGNDHIDGGSGGDAIMVKDGYVDHVNCQGGNDDVSNRDPFDILRNC
jgi:hypothetical protein